MIRASDVGPRVSPDITNATVNITLRTCREFAVWPNILNVLNRSKNNAVSAPEVKATDVCLFF